jgi:hypothetical protein
MSVNYVAAGIEAYSGTPGQLHVTYEANEKESSHFGRKYKQWLTTDKTITYAKGGGKKSIMAAPSDVMVPIGSAAFVKACGLTKILANPIHKSFDKTAFEALGIESIVDSGGFQMLKGTVPFVHPDDVVKRYNDTANIGMPLDLPVRGSVEHLYFDPVSKMIKANDKYILDRLNPGIDLALISHGTSLERRKRRLDVLDRDAKVIAIAGLNIKPAPGVDHVYNSVENLMYVIHRYHKTARYFHVLGVTSKLWIFIYALLDATGYVKSIGGDSVSHRLGALVGMYDTYDFDSVELNRKTPYKTSLPCNCPICSVVDDSRIIQESMILESHNLWVRSKQTELLSDMAKSYVKGTLPIREVYKILRLTMGEPRFVAMIRYIEEIMVTNKFKPLRHGKKAGSLFAVAPKHEISDSTKALSGHYKEVLSKYEKFHKVSFFKK